MNWFFGQHTKKDSVRSITALDAPTLPGAMWSADAGSEAVYQDRRFSTLRSQR